LISEENDGGPDEKGSFTRVGYTVRDGANVVHQHVGRDGLIVEEDPVEQKTGEHGGVGGRDLLPVREEDKGGDGEDQAGSARVELELGGAVLEVLARDQHL